MEIDFVILWVDGNDIEWQKIKQKYDKDTIDDSNTERRFRDWGIFHYWFRGVEKYAPWVRKIHLITWGHIPSFLKTDHPKLNIVNHIDFIPAKYLPTFNSNTIELNLHRIPDLAEHFVLFNDDVFLLKHISKRSFFHNQMPCAHFNEVPFPLYSKMETWNYMAINNIAIINKYFCKKEVFKKTWKKILSSKYSVKDRFQNLTFFFACPGYYVGFRIFHMPGAICKSELAEIWDKEYEILNETCSHKFRHMSDVNQWLIQWWQLAKGKYEPKREFRGSFDLEYRHINDICHMIKKQEFETICLNDMETDEEKVYGEAALLEKAFSEILSEKCSFEI